MPQDQKTKNIKQKQYHNKFNKDFKHSPHKKKQTNLIKLHNRRKIIVSSPQIFVFCPSVWIEEINKSFDVLVGNFLLSPIGMVQNALWSHKVKRLLLSLEFHFKNLDWLYPESLSVFPGLSEKVKSLSRLWLFVTPWTVAYLAPPCIGFSRQEYWSGLPFPSAGDLPDPGIEPGCFALQADSLLSEPPCS